MKAQISSCFLLLCCPQHLLFLHGPRWPHELQKPLVPSPARVAGGNQRAEKGTWEATPCTPCCGPASQSPELYHMATPKGYPGLICWGGREGERSWRHQKCLLAVTANPQGSRSMLSAVLASLWPASASGLLVKLIHHSVCGAVRELNFLAHE